MIASSALRARSAGHDLVIPGVGVPEGSLSQIGPSREGSIPLAEQFVSSLAAPPSSVLPKDAIPKKIQDVLSDVDKLSEQLRDYVIAKKFGLPADEVEAFRDVCKKLSVASHIEDAQKLQLLEKLHKAVLLPLLEQFTSGKVNEPSLAGMQSLIERSIRPIEHELLTRDLGALAGVSKLKVTAAKFDFELNGVTISANCGAGGTLQNITITSGKFIGSIEEPLSPKELLQLVGNLRNAQTLLQKATKSESGTFRVQNRELFDFSTGGKVFVVSPRDVLELVANPRAKELQEKLSAAKQTYEKATDARKHHLKKYSLEKIYDDNFRFTGMSEDRIEQLFEKGKISKESVAPLKDLALLSKKQREAEGSLATAQTAAGVRILEGKDRFDRAVQVEEYTSSGSEKFNRVYRANDGPEKKGKELATFSSYTGSFITGKNGEGRFNLSRLQELLPDGTREITLLAQNFGRPYEIVRNDPKGIPLLKKTSDPESPILGPKSIENYRDRKIQDFGPDGKLVLERKFAAFNAVKQDDEREKKGVLSRQTSARAYNSRGDWIGTFQEMKKEKPSLKIETYLQGVAEWSKEDPRLVHTFLREFMEYRNDWDLHENPFRNIPGSERDYWQTPQQTVERTGKSKQSAEFRLMLGDCDDLAFLAQDILKRQGYPALVLGIPGHAICMVLEKNKIGRYDVFTIGTEGFDRNGKADLVLGDPRDIVVHKDPGLSIYPEYSREGYRSIASALEAAFYKYKKGGFGISKEVTVNVDPSEGFHCLTIPKQGVRAFIKAPLEAAVRSDLQTDFLLAQQALYSGDAKKASAGLEAINRRFPHHLILAHLGLAQAMAGEAEKSKVTIAKALAAAPENLFVLGQAALSASAGGEQGEAKRYLRTVVSKIAGAESGVWDVIQGMEHSSYLANKKEGDKKPFLSLLRAQASEYAKDQNYREEAVVFAETLYNRGGEGKNVLRLRREQIQSFEAEYERAKAKGEVPMELSKRYRHALSVMVLREKEFGTPRSMEEARKRLLKAFPGVADE